MAEDDNRSEPDRAYSGTLYRVRRSRYGEQTLSVGGTEGEAATLGADLVDRDSHMAGRLRGERADDVVHVCTPFMGSVVYRVLEARGPDAGRLRPRPRTGEAKKPQARRPTVANSWDEAVTWLQPEGRNLPFVLGRDEVWQRLLTNEAKIAALVMAAEQEWSSGPPASDPQATWIRELAIERSCVPDLISDTWPSLPQAAKLRVCALVARYDIPWSRLRELARREGDLGIACLLNLVFQAQRYG